MLSRHMTSFWPRMCTCLGFVTMSLLNSQAYHMFFVLLPDAATRNATLATLHDRGVHATFHYVPLHSSDAGRRFAAREIECPVTEDISGRLLRFPFYNNLTDAEAEQVVSAFSKALAGAAAIRG